MDRHTDRRVRAVRDRASTAIANLWMRVRAVENDGATMHILPGAPGRMIRTRSAYPVNTFSE